jgi:hypothetical protein
LIFNRKNRFEEMRQIANAVTPGHRFQNGSIILFQINGSNPVSFLSAEAFRFVAPASERDGLAFGDTKPARDAPG